ncbi:hypothetical protein KP509_11G079100 [Ceratopteris richardii]|uniref:RING-type domain-containing protein n=1 Tax=Ceratopteris richardii TaxID=49495 RepID=A0A8T2TZT7_CERRI|nr:hypothetical protein KP509_11G079100 [Ceratopteris richardii]
MSLLIISLSLVHCTEAVRFQANAGALPRFIHSNFWSSSLGYVWALFNGHLCIVLVRIGPITSRAMSQNGTAMAGVGENMNTVGLGYGIAIAVGILVLVSTIMLASYVCVRVHGRGRAARVRGDSEAAVADIGSSHMRPGDTAPNNRHGDVDTARIVRGNDGGAIPSSQGSDWVVGGLDEATLESYPKFSYAEKKLYHGHHDADDASCSICLADYRNGELIRMLPDCKHSFHADCVDAWLRLHASCPMCRTSPLPTPIPTPLSELIPLARHPLQAHYR